MSVNLLKVIANTSRLYLPRLPTKSEIWARFVTANIAMEINNIDTKDDDFVPNKKMTRYRKRQWENAAPSLKENGEPEEKKERIKKKKVAILLGYCGVDYHGMQRNPGVRTIEEDLLKALFDAKYISEEGYANHQAVDFQRSSRTDKGVSAARQVVSVKLPVKATVEEINKRLPDCIKVFSIKRVTKRFNSKIKCNARTYTYTLPTYTFEPNLNTEEERKQYRIGEEKLQKVKDVLSYYKGTKSYINFTEKKQFGDPSASRYMMEFKVDKVFTERDMEFAVLSVKGQSFMLHQIRKMVGLMIAIVRGQTDMATLEKAFSKEKVTIPTAPGLGLVLDKVHYEKYSEKFKDSHESLTWESEEEQVQKFLHEHVYPVIVKGEIEDNSMGLWLEKVKEHSYEPGAINVNDGENDEVNDDDDDDDVNENKETKNKVDAHEDVIKHVHDSSEPKVSV